MLETLINKLEEWGYKVTPPAVDEPIVGSIQVRIDSYTAKAGAFGRLEQTWIIELTIKEKDFMKLVEMVQELAPKLYEAFGAFSAYETVFDYKNTLAKITLRLITTEVQ